MLQQCYNARLNLSFWAHGAWPRTECGVALGLGAVGGRAPALAFATGADRAPGSMINDQHHVLNSYTLYL